MEKKNYTPQPIDTNDVVLPKELNELGRKTVNKKNWSASSVLTVLRNEKYVGDIEMQKTITKDFLTHRSTINKGEAPRY